ncbi:MAG: hypothetical protein ACI92Z_001027 [Paracoccaceae bacterium]|jgi:hypothetical protein
MADIKVEGNALCKFVKMSNKHTMTFVYCLQTYADPAMQITPCKEPKLVDKIVTNTQIPVSITQRSSIEGVIFGLLNTFGKNRAIGPELPNFSPDIVGDSFPL